MKTIFSWRIAALCFVIGFSLIAFHYVQYAHAFSSPSFYPVGFQSYAGNPCPSSITVNGQGINLGSNCSAMNNTVAFIDPTSQSDMTGATVVIGPNWTQQCKDGSVKSLQAVTWTGKLPNHGQNTGPITIHTWPTVCPGYYSYPFTIRIVSSPYGDSWEWNGLLYNPG